MIELDMTAVLHSLLATLQYGLIVTGALLAVAVVTAGVLVCALIAEAAE